MDSELSDSETSKTRFCKLPAARFIQSNSKFKEKIKSKTRRISNNFQKILEAFYLSFHMPGHIELYDGVNAYHRGHLGPRS